MTIICNPDAGIPMPPDNLPFADFKERAAAACTTAELLGIDMTPTDEDLEVAESIVNGLALNEDKTAKKLNAKGAPAIRPATYGMVDSIMKEFAVRVVDNAAHIRLVVTNKLLLETENEDPKIRLRALELLGKITDVGLFTEKTEVTITHRSTEDLKNRLREKLHKMMHPQGVEDVKTINVNGETVDLDKEMGLDTENTTPQTENDDEKGQE